MRASINRLGDFLERWIRKRFALPLSVALAAALLVVSETTHRDTVSTVQDTISLTDARTQSHALLQLMTDAEAAQFGYLVTGRADYLARYARAKADLPELQRTVAAFYASLGADGAAAAQRVTDFTQRKFSQFDHTILLVRAVKLEQAIELARESEGLAEMQALRQDMLALLARAAQRQGQARASIFDALQVNRVAVGSLTLGALLILILFVRQLQQQDQERSARQAALSRQRERLEVEVQRRTSRLADLATHLQTVREDERARVARELHDELGGLLTASKLDIARARNKADEPAELLACLERINEHLTNGIALKRRIIEGLRPSALADLGLTAALDNLCQDMSASLAIPVQLSAADFKLSKEAELAVYRFVQEALTNIGKYASATRVEVTLAVVGVNATVEVRDDGVGFEPQDTYAGHHGLAGMQFRAETLGGAMRVNSSPGQGTTVRIEFPQTPQ